MSHLREAHDIEENHMLGVPHFFNRSEMSLCGQCGVPMIMQLICVQWLETLRPVTGAKTQVIHLGIPMTELCGV